MSNNDKNDDLDTVYDTQDMHEADLIILRHYALYLDITDKGLTVKPIPGLTHDRFRDIEGVLAHLINTNPQFNYSPLPAGTECTLTSNASDFTMKLECNQPGLTERVREVARYMADNEVNFPRSEVYRSKTV